MAWLIQPLLFLFALGSGLESLSAASTDGVDLKTFIFPGVLCMAVLFTAMISAASLVWDRELGWSRRYKWCNWRVEVRKVVPATAGPRLVG